VPQATTRLLGLGADAAARWLQRQAVWTPESLLRVAGAMLDKFAAERDTLRLESAGVALSQRLDSANHELQLLYDLIRHLSISSSAQTFGRLALSWLQARVPAEAVAIVYLPVARPGEVTFKARTETLWLSAGRCPIGSEALAAFVRGLDLRPEVNLGQDDPATSGETAPTSPRGDRNTLAAGRPPYVATSAMTARADWPLAGIRQLIVAPLVEGPHVFGWLAACNHTRDEDFGSAEAGLLRSVGVLLGIHSGNREFYRQ
jgi:hypothetical protein